MNFNVKQFDQYREDNRLEVKQATGGLPNSLWETYSAFANTSGGCIVLGVKELDDKSWVATGLKNANKTKKDFFDLLHNQRKVSVPLVGDQDATIYQVDGVEILVINVPKASREDKPVFINDDIWGGTYQRDGEGDYHCSKGAVLAMLRDQTAKSSDMKVLENKEISDFNQDSVKAYRLRYNAAHEESPRTQLPDDEFLLQIGAASEETEDGRIHPTAAGLLMFGVYHKIMREYPNFLLDYYEKYDPALRWTDRLASHNGDWSGNIYDFYSKTYMKIAVDLKKPFRLNGIYRVDDTPIHVAVREVLCNCLSNADFFLRGSVKVEKYPDKLVFTNPGTILLGKKQALRGGKSEPRNRTILNMLNYIGVGERAGSGVPNVCNIWKNEGLDEPIVEEESGREGTICTIVTLPLSKNVINSLFWEKTEKEQKRNRKGTRSSDSRKVAKKNEENVADEIPTWASKKTRDLLTSYSDSKRRSMLVILSSIKTDNKTSSAQIAATANLSARTVQRYIKELRENGVVSRKRNDRSGYWIINK